MLTGVTIGFYIFFVILVIFILTALFKASYIVRQSEVILIERLGKFHKLLDSGFHVVIPFLDQPRKVLWSFLREDAQRKYTYRYSEYVERVDLREAVYDFPRQNVITRDNVTMEINALLYYQITDPKRAVYEVSNLPQAIEKLTQTTLRNIIGAMDLDETLVSRDLINEKLREILDEATDKWGVKVNRVEIQEVTPPQDIRIAMEKQMKAERDRRAAILEAEGQKQAAILAAEGDKLSKITRAQGEAEARLVMAQAESEAIQKVQKAVPSADPLPYLIALNYIKVLPEMTGGKDSKIVMLPYESSAVMSSLATIKELFNK